MSRKGEVVHELKFKARFKVVDIVLILSFMMKKMNKKKSDLISNFQYGENRKHHQKSGL